MLSLHDTLSSGQVFRFRLEKDGAWLCHRDRVVFVGNDGTVKGEHAEWAERFFRHDQPVLKHAHPYVQEALDAHPGLRVLRQDPWECLVTFVISQNNHQKRIQQNCVSLARAFGEPLTKGFHSFPTPSELGTESELRKLGLGYRAPYITTLKDIDLDWLDSLRTKTYEEAKAELCTLPGVGPKVADCVLLFSLGFDEACPEDVWIKRVFAEHDISKETLGPKAGLLQQYLFHHARSARFNRSL